tara:strand:+ start:357 stop:1049 length:693 start_codon:yes stop_codon:yes gene_type:complete
MKRRCGCCREYGHFNRKNARCPNEARVLAEKEKRRQEKIAERKKNARLKRLRGDNRQTMNGRAGSSRNGFVRTYTTHRAGEFRLDEVEARNLLLGVDPKTCFWCKARAATDLDHYIPTCRTTKNVYGLPHELNMFPACKKCNSSEKGGKIPSEWNKILKEKLNWSDEQIAVLDNWREANYSKLGLVDSHFSYLNENFGVINIFHAIGHQCGAKGLNIADYVTMDTSILEG